MEIIPNSQANDQLQEEIADLERKFLLAKKVSLKKSIADLTSTNNTSSQSSMPSQTSSPDSDVHRSEHALGLRPILRATRWERIFPSIHARISLHRHTTHPGHKKKQVQARKHRETQHQHKKDRGDCQERQTRLIGSQNRDSGRGLHRRRRQEHCVAASFFSRIQANSSFPRPLGRSISTESCPRQVH